MKNNRFAAWESEFLIKVLCVYHRPIPSPSADSVQIMKMCHGFQKAGCDTTLLAPQQTGWKLSADDLWERYGISHPFQVNLIDGCARLRGHDAAIKTFVASAQRKFDVVYCRNLPAAMWASQWGIPTIIDAHGPPGERMAAIYLRLAFAGSGFRRLNVITKPLATAYTLKFRKWLSESQIFVDPNAVDIEDFENLPSPAQARALLDLPNTYTVGYIGHMYPGRGTELILSLAQQLPQIQFLLAGGTENDVTRVKALAEQRNIGNTTFLGLRPNRELPLIYAACDVLLMPYQRKVAVFGGTGDSSTYMSPMKMFEYMASNRLIISSDLPILREVLNTTNSVLCDPENEEAWKNAILRAATEPVWAEVLYRQARKDVEQHTWEKRALRTLAIAVP